MLIQSSEQKQIKTEKIKQTPNFINWYYKYLEHCKTLNLSKTYSLQCCFPLVYANRKSITINAIKIMQIINVKNTQALLNFFVYLIIFMAKILKIDLSCFLVYQSAVLMSILILNFNSIYVMDFSNQ